MQVHGYDDEAAGDAQGKECDEDPDAEPFPKLPAGARGARFVLRALGLHGLPETRR